MKTFGFAIVITCLAFLLPRTAFAEKDNAHWGFAASTKDGVSSKTETPPAPTTPASRHGGYIQADAHYTELRSLDDVMGGRFGFGFRAKFGLKAGLEFHLGVVDAMSVCIPPSIPASQVGDCVLHDRDTATYFGLGPALGYNLRFVGGLGGEASLRYNHLAHGNTKGYSVSGGPSLYYNFDALSKGAVPVSLRVGMEYGRHSYELAGVDISANAITFVGGIGVWL